MGVDGTDTMPQLRSALVRNTRGAYANMIGMTNSKLLADTVTSISLGDVGVEFTVDEDPVRVVAKGIQYLFPDPLLVFEVDDVRRPKPSGRVPVSTDGPTSVRLDNGLDVQVVPTRWLFRQDSASIHLAQSPTEVVRSDKPIARLEFGVLNFSWRGLRHSLSLETSEWLVSITPVPGLGELEKVLRDTHGYAETHRGVVERSDGGTFTVDAAVEILEVLNHFLSFLCGAHCSVNNAVGTCAKGVEVWKRWGAFHVSRWRRATTWYDITVAHPLSDLFGEFFQEYQTHRNGLGRIVRLYAESNATSNLDVSIILAQTALETFAHIWFGEKDRRVLEGVWIDNALKKFLVPTHVPGRLRALRQHAQENGWEHGPHAIVELRNPLVHSRQNVTSTPVDVEHEAKQLALWFVELSLLRVLGFSGNHACRLNQVHRAGATELVPWSQGC